MFEKIQSWFTSIFKKSKKIEKPHELKLKPKKPKKPKSYITHHAKVRFQQRHGIIFTDEQVKSIVDDIISKKAQFIKIVSNKAQQWMAVCDGKKYIVIYSPKRKIIITVYSGLKNKKSKPHKKKRDRINGTHRTNWRKKPKPVTYKRNKRVTYEDMVV